MSAFSYLTPKERAAILKVAAEDAVDDYIAGTTKQASGGASAAVATGGAMAGGIAAGGIKTVAALSILTGIPIGLAWHALSEGSKITDNKQRDALKRIEYYNNAAKGMEQKLSLKGNK